jgi:hypothetical protein
MLKLYNLLILHLYSAGHDDEIAGEVAEDHAGGGGRDAQQGDQQQAL